MEFALLAVSLPFLLASVSVLTTVVHTADEVVSEYRTIWEYLADVYGWLPRLNYEPSLMILLLFGGLQCGFAVVGYAGGDRAALWILAAIRVGDCLVSHWGPWLAGWAPNPGLMSTPLYAIDAAIAGAAAAGAVY